MKVKFKKIMTTVLTGLVVISSVPSYGAKPRFKDMPTNHWAYEYVEEMAKLNYVSGYPDGTFKPTGNLTFIEAMTMVSKLVEITPAEKTKAIDKHKPLLKELKILEWAHEGLAIALEGKVLTEGQLRQIAQDGKINSVINKQDTSVYLARAMGLEQAANDIPIVFIEYKDVLDIDQSKRKYLEVLIDAGVLDPKGGGDGRFEPRSSLQRQVMTTMLSKGYEYLQKNPIIPEPEPKPEPEVEKPEVIELETLNATIKRVTDEIGRKIVVVEDRYGKEEGYIVVGSSHITIDGKTSSASLLSAGQDVEIKFKKNSYDIVSIDAISKEEDIEGVVKSINSSSYKMTLEYRDGNSVKEKTYDIDKDVKLYIDDKSANLYELKSGDRVDIRSRNNIIYDIEAESKVEKVEGIIKDIEKLRDGQNSDYYITIVDSKDNVHEFLIDSKTSLYRNNRRINSGADLKVKDKAYIIGEYDIVTDKYIADDIDASVVRKNVKGIIAGMNTRLNKETELTILNQETRKEESYILGKDVYIRVDRELTNSLDLRTGYYVDITVEGDEITDIDADSAGIEEPIIGRIDSINTRSGVLTLTIENFGLEGLNYGDEITVYTKSNVLITDRLGEKIYFDDLRRRDRVIVIGDYDGLSLIANTIQKR